MSEQWSAPGWAVVTLAVLLVLELLVVGVVLARSRRRARSELATLSAQNALLLERLEALEHRAARPTAPQRTEDDREYVITHLGDQASDSEPEPEPAPVVPAPVFADLVLRETAAQSAMLVAGLRRALSPEVRHRIRFEMRREVKRARKQRRADLRAARRDLHARQRAAEQAA